MAMVTWTLRYIGHFIWTTALKLLLKFDITQKLDSRNSSWQTILWQPTLQSKNSAGLSKCLSFLHDFSKCLSLLHDFSKCLSLLRVNVHGIMKVYGVISSFN